jgi:hypothetical protein
MARLAGLHDLGERLHRLLERCVPVIAVTLIEVDVVGAKPRERGVDLLVDLPTRQTAVAGGHRPEELRRKHVGVARPVGEHLTEELLGLPARVDVRGVDEVDADVEGLPDAGLRLLSLDAAAVREP